MTREASTQGKALKKIESAGVWPGVIWLVAGKKNRRVTAQQLNQQLEYFNFCEFQCWMGGSYKIVKINI